MRLFVLINGSFSIPELAGEKITIEEEVLDDVKSAIDYSNNDERLKQSKKVVIGHSLGGRLASKIAVDNTSISGILNILSRQPKRLRRSN